MSEKTIDQKSPNIFGLLKSYSNMIIFLLLCSVVGSGLNLWLPKIIAQGIDAYSHNTYVLKNVLWYFLSFSLGVFIFTYIQGILQTYVSERVARDLREKITAKISRQSYSYIQTASPARLLTNITADIDSVKMFVAQAVVSIVSSIFIIIGASVLLLSMDWKLALVILTIIPIIGTIFFIVFGKVRVLFLKSREVIDRLNKVINESILGAAIIRVLHAKKYEEEKFLTVNTDAKNLGLRILQLFASMIPVITFVSNMAIIAILALGGHFVITGAMTLGDIAAFNSYVMMLIFPVLIIGFMSNIIAQSTASYQRINEVLDAPEPTEEGTIKKDIRGDIAVEDISLSYSDKPVLKEVSFRVAAGTRTAIIGPTAAGKSQLLYLLTGLIPPDKGTITYDGVDIQSYNKESLHNQIGFVFQDSIVFNISIRENIGFNVAVKEEDLERAIETAELQDFITSLPEGLETMISERGTTLSGGQKQRLMLARALALNPRILLLDDFTARVDALTEQKILNNVLKNYPGMTLVSVTQKIASVENYDQIILLMEGEVLAQGTHQELLRTSPEYVQIYNSQRSTNHYELRTE